MGYKEATIEDTAAEQRKATSGTSFFKAPEGTTRLRIMPPHENHPTNTWFYYISTHGNIPGVGRPVLCPNRMEGLPCPACNEANRLRSIGDDRGAMDMSAKWRGMMNVVALNKDGTVPADARVQVWDAPREQIIDALNAKVAELPRDQQNISSPSKGMDVYVRRTGQGTRTKYEITPAPEGPSPFTAEHLLDDIYFLPDVPMSMPAPTMQAYISGEVETTALPSPRRESRTESDFDPFATENVIEGVSRVLEDTNLVDDLDDEDTPWDNSDDREAALARLTGKVV